MSTSKVAVTLDVDLLSQLDDLVTRRVFPNRSKAIQKAVEEKLNRMRRSRLARECAKLDPHAEMTLAEEGMKSELKTWPEY